VGIKRGVCWAPMPALTSSYMPPGLARSCTSRAPREGLCLGFRHTNLIWPFRTLKPSSRSRKGKLRCSALRAQPQQGGKVRGWRGEPALSIPHVWRWQATSTFRRRREWWLGGFKGEAGCALHGGDFNGVRCAPAISRTAGPFPK